MLGNTAAQHALNAANGILKNPTIAVPLKYLSNFWRSLEMSFVNCKVEIELNWTKYCVLSVASTENDVNDNDNDNKLFLLSKTENYMFVL